MTARKTSGTPHGGIPRDGCAPVVSDDDGFLLVEGAHQADDVADEMKLRIGLDPGGRIGAAVAALVRRNDAIALFRECRDLVPPGVPGLRKAVAEDHQRAVSSLCDMHVDAVRLYGAVVDFAQGPVSPVWPKVGDGANWSPPMTRWKMIGRTPPARGSANVGANSLSGSPEIRDARNTRG